MIEKLKNRLYFPIANYFRFFANIRLQRWKPRIIVVTGSNGKTTLLHLLEAQFGEQAIFSHHANSSFGIPFYILDLHRKTLLKSEWLSLFLKAPVNAFKTSPKEKIYIVEADADRPLEGKFLAEFLKPEVVLWVSVSRTHAMNFDTLVKSQKFPSVDEAIAFEFGFFLEYCQKFAVINGDLPLELGQVDRTQARVKILKKEKTLESYEVTQGSTVFKFNEGKYTFPVLFPQEVFYSLAMCREAIEYFGLPFDKSFSKLHMPPGRSSLFQGVHGITIVDSSYNANLSSMQAIITMFGKISAKNKWAVIGDMLEQGNGEKEEHEKLAEILSNFDFERIVFMGPRVTKYTYPKMQQIIKNKIPMDAFPGPKETLDFITQHLTGGETILFKGARFMEGIIEHLLKDKSDEAKLARREKIWQIRRKSWGL